MARLGDICTIYTGTGFPVQYQGETSGEYPFYKVGDISRNVAKGNVFLQECDNFISAETAKKIKGTIIPAKTIVFAKIGEAVKLNRRAITAQNCLVDNNAMGICPDPQKLCLSYFYHFMCNLKLETYAEATTVPAVKKSVVEKLEIPLPEYEEQLRISALFDEVDNGISLRKQQLAYLDELVKSRFIELFGDPVSNPHRFDKVALSELADIKIGPFGSLLHKEDYIEGGHALLNPSHIIDGKVAPDNKLTVSTQKYEELSAYHLKTGDVVMGRRGEMGRCAVVPCDGYLCGTGSLMIRTKGEVTADYIQKIISFPSFKKTIEDMAIGQTMPNLNVPIVSNFQIIKPPIEVQKSYYAFVEQTDKSKLEVQKSLEKLEVLKKALMQKYFG